MYLINMMEYVAFNIVIIVEIVVLLFTMIKSVKCLIQLSYNKLFLICFSIYDIFIVIKFFIIYRIF